MPPSPSLRVLWLLVSMAVIEDVCGSEDQVAEPVDGPMDQVAGQVNGFMDRVAVVVGRVVEQHLTGCHLVLATTADNTSVFSRILRRLAGGGEASTVVDVGLLFSQGQPAQYHLLQGLWGDVRFSCRALILYIGTTYNTLLFRFLESSGLWLWPETSVIVVGTRTWMETVLLDASLRNAVHTLYLALEILPHSRSPLLRKGTSQQEERVRVEAYRRCLHCNRGEMGVHSVQQWNPSSRVPLEHNLFPERPENFMGHTLKIVALPYFPYIAYEKNSEDPDGPVSPRDALNIRMMNAIAAQLNLTYEIREPSDGKWGVPLANGSWTGIVGTLQQQQADLSLDLTQTASRTEAISFTRVYTRDVLVIVSLKPGVLPRHLALIRPLTGELWSVIAACTFVFGVVLWLLQRIWSSLSGERSLGLGSAIFYSWGVLLEDPPTDPPANVSGRMLMGLWLLSSIVIGTAYRSSLIAHLAVQNKFLPINSFEDVLSRNGWSWGCHDISGTTFLYFNQSSDPVVQEIYKKMQIIDVEKGIERVLAGGFSYISYKSLFLKDMENLYDETKGETPLHLGSTEYVVMGGNSWGARRGAPFIGQIVRMKQRMLEAGLITRWQDDLVKMRVIIADKSGAGSTVSSESHLVLGLDHLQGAFYLLLLGYIIAFFTLLGENLARSCPVPLHRQQSHLLEDSFFH